MVFFTASTSNVRWHHEQCVFYFAKLPLEGSTLCPNASNACTWERVCLLMFVCACVSAWQCTSLSACLSGLPGLACLAWPACLKECLHESTCFNINMHANAQASQHSCLACLVWPGLPGCLQVCLHKSIGFNINMHANARACLHTCMACMARPDWTCLPAGKYTCMRAFVLFRLSLKTPLTGSDIA